jgi:L-aminopeptidase/D-esterase-like protein
LPELSGAVAASAAPAEDDPEGAARGRDEVSDPPPLPDGFAVGHWSDPEGGTGCTVVLPPAETRAGVCVHGGGPGTRETDVLRPLANAQEANAILITGGSAFGLAAADGVVRWLEEHERGYFTPYGRVPLVPAAVIYDLPSGSGPASRPGPDAGYAACEAAEPGVPERGPVGAGTGATVGKILGRDRARPGGVGYAALVTGTGHTVAAVAAVNAAGDVIDEDGSVLAGPGGKEGEVLRGAEAIAAMEEPPQFRVPGGNSTPVCVCTDATLGKRGCSMVARTATAGLGRAVDPVFTPVDGDVVFCLASGREEPDPFAPFQIGAAAATVTAAAIRDAVRKTG